MNQFIMVIQLILKIEGLSTRVTFEILDTIMHSEHMPLQAGMGYELHITFFTLENLIPFLFMVSFMLFTVL